MWGSPVTIPVQVPRLLAKRPQEGIRMSVNAENLEAEFIELLASANEVAAHAFVHIMRTEAARIGLDLQENLARLGIGPT